MATPDALRRAEEQSLELVEVNPKAQPPVCKILDYGKFKYEVAKREREGKKNKSKQEMKEVKFRPKIGDHDFNFKVKHARRFLEEGNKVRLLVQFRGREVVHPETGKAVLERVCKETADLATVVQLANMEGNRMSMILGPKARRQVPANPGKVADAGTDELDDDLDDDDDEDDEDDDSTPVTTSGGDSEDAQTGAEA